MVNSVATHTRANSDTRAGFRWDDLTIGLGRHLARRWAMGAHDHIVGCKFAGFIVIARVRARCVRLECRLIFMTASRLVSNACRRTINSLVLFAFILCALRISGPYRNLHIHTRSRSRCHTRTHTDYLRASVSGGGWWWWYSASRTSLRARRRIIWVSSHQSRTASRIHTVVTFST